MKNSQRIQRVLLVTLLLNLVVLGIKAGASWQTGSLSLWVDALHSLTDSLNNVVALVTSRLAAARPDQEHPYGHHKFEAIGVLFITAFMGVACLEVLKTWIERLTHSGPPVKMSVGTLGAMLIVISINILVARYEKYVGQRTRSPLLIADAAHTMSDVWVTLIVILGLISTRLGLPWLDLLLTVPILGLVLHSIWEIIKINIPWLVDEVAIDPQQIYVRVRQVPGVVSCQRITSRGFLGRQVFIELHISVAAVDIATGHQIVERVKHHLQRCYHPAYIMIQIQPILLLQYQSTNNFADHSPKTCN